MVFLRMILFTLLLFSHTEPLHSFQNSPEKALKPQSCRNELIVQWPATIPKEVRQTYESALNMEPCTSGAGTASLRVELILGNASKLPHEELWHQELSTDDSSVVATVRITAGRLRGALYGLNTLLEKGGVSWLHPLKPLVPGQLKTAKMIAAVASANTVPDSPPFLRLRGIHLHTMHPTELCEMLNGWGPEGPNDEAGFDESLQEWRLFLMWATAQRINQVQWILLEGASWKEFANSDVRLNRLRRLVEIGRTWDIEIGLDAALNLKQQHAWRLIREGDTNRIAAMQQRIDWLMSAGFDYLSTELGTTEFTHGEEEKILEEMNAFALHLRDQHNSYGTIKVHVSSNQKSENFVDPETGEPVNINFLPQFSDPSLGVLPHTVQHYSLDDPTQTYGNEDFSGIRRFMNKQAGERLVLFYPESAYWVSFDTDVPLFLPLYAQRRLYDLRLIARDADARGGEEIDGQMVFSSGWEWGYWLGDVVAARAAWNPHLQTESLHDAFAEILENILGNLESDGLSSELSAIAETQHKTLILGEVAGSRPDNVTQRNGQAYLQGMEAADDLGLILRSLGMDITTQPDRLPLLQVLNRRQAKETYTELVRPLLQLTAESFLRHAHNMSDLDTQNPLAQDFLQEFKEGMHVTALRAQQVAALYDHAASRGADTTSLWTAQRALRTAQRLVESRQQAYRVPLDRIAGWRHNPTVYPYAFLWAVKNLFYWHRDEARARGVAQGPCFRNTVNVLRVIGGPTFAADALSKLREWLEGTPLLGGLTRCLAEPPREPVPGKWQFAQKG